mgnify:CR=1 FL=1
MFNGQLRTRQYTQQATASLRVNIAKQKWLSWLQLQPISVSTNYQWRDQPSAAAPDLEVASAGASASGRAASPGSRASHPPSDTRRTTSPPRWPSRR